MSNVYTTNWCLAAAVNDKNNIIYKKFRAPARLLFIWEFSLITISGMIKANKFISRGGNMTFFKKTIRDVPLSGHTVLVRVDYNVPLAQDGSISDDLRIRMSIPTLQYLLARGCKLVQIGRVHV